MLKKIFLFLLFFAGLHGNSFGAQILVENVFSDISASYEYRDELQTLYDRGMIIPDLSGRFNPDAFLNRDEFVGIAMEVICERCISPHTDYQYVEKYFDADVYFDIENDNRYFYCVAEADDRNSVRGYGLGESCQDGTSSIGQRPFCPLNRINLEEAIAVLLRNSGIFTIEDNAQVVENIRAGNINETLGNDVSPTNPDGSPYTFYGYLRRALSYSITEYDISGQATTFNLLELDADGSVNPRQEITKEQFLRMSYIALKSNNCTEIEDNGLALRMNIFERSCSQGDENCTLSDLEDPQDTYDFESVVEGVCELGIEDPTGYIWRYQNLTNGRQEISYGPYIDNHVLSSDGEWRIYLRVVDRCGNTSEIYSTIFVGDDISPPIIGQEIDVDIDVYDDSCSFPGNDCTEIQFENEEDDGDNIFDFDGDVSTTCRIGDISYNWQFTNTTTGDRYTYEGEYIDDILFGRNGIWNIVLNVVDGCGNTGTEQMTYTVGEENSPSIVNQDIDVDIDVYDDSCNPVDINCNEIYFANEEDDGDNIFDFAADVDSTFEADELSYDWVFIHPETGTISTFTGPYVDDFEFTLPGEWIITLTVTDPDGNTGSEQMTYIIGDLSTNSSIDIDIDVYDDNCSPTDINCNEIDFASEEDDGDNIFDFAADVDSPFEANELIYEWVFTHPETGTTSTFTGPYVDDFEFTLPGEWIITLTVTDPDGNSGTEQMTYIVTDISPVTVREIDVDIDVYDDSCNFLDTTCVEIEFENEEDDGDDIFDFAADIDTSFSADELIYEWTFTHPETGTTSTFTTQYIDDFYFSLSGVWTISLTVTDPDGNSGTEQMTYIIIDNINVSPPYSIDVSILADPIFGYEDLLVDFEGEVSGGTGPYVYSWDFGDGENAFGEDVDHLYDSDGTFGIELTVTDINGATGTATVVIIVLDADSCNNDSDADNINDCDDACPLVPGDIANAGCPILESSCDLTCGCATGYTCSDSDPLTCGTGVCEPDFDPNPSCLYDPGEGGIFGTAICTTCPCNAFLDFRANVRRCDLIFPAITSPDGSEIYSRGNTWQIQ